MYSRNHLIMTALVSFLLFLISWGSPVFAQQGIFPDLISVDTTSPASPTKLQILRPGESLIQQQAIAVDPEATPTQQGYDEILRREFFVDNIAGNDANSGLEGSPWASLNYAASIAQAGDTVFIISNGSEYPYEGKVIPQNSGEPERWIVFKGIGEEKPEIVAEGEDALLIIHNKHYLEFNNLSFPRSDGQGAVVRASSQHIRLIDLTIENIQKNGIAVNSGGYIEVIGCVLNNIGNNGIAFIGSPTDQLHDTRVEGCAISNVRNNDGITLHKNMDGDDVGARHVIKGNRLFRNNEQGLDITSGSDILLIDNQTSENIISGVVVGHGAKNVTIQGHESLGDIKYGVILSESDTVVLRDSIIRDTVTKAELQITRATNVVVSNNVFYSSGNVRIDYVPTATSGVNVLFFENTIQATGEQAGAIFRCLNACSFAALPGLATFVRNVWWGVYPTDERFFSDHYNKINFTEFQIRFAVDDRFEESVYSELQQSDDQ